MVPDNLSVLGMWTLPFARVIPSDIKEIQEIILLLKYYYLYIIIIISLVDEMLLTWCVCERENLWIWQDNHFECMNL